MAKTTKFVEPREGYFEIWEETYDDKGKLISRRQSGVAVHEPTPIGFNRMLALVDPFKPRE